MTTLLDSGAIHLCDFLPDGEDWFARLVPTIAWDERLRARKSASFGLPYNYSGILWPETAFPAVLLPLLDQLTQRLGYRPNNCLANYYPTGESTMGFHSDAVAELALGSFIAVVSLGAERRITFRRQSEPRVQESYPLKSGSLLLMSLDMQSCWKHAILAADAVTQGRISLTFRRMTTGTQLREAGIGVNPGKLADL